jgi:hypothetical protein
MYSNKNMLTDKPQMFALERPWKGHWADQRALGSDHSNQQLIQHNDSVWTPYVMLRAPLLGVKTAL